MDEKKLKIRRQAFALTVCTVVFMAVYNFTAWRTSLLEDVSSFTFDFEKEMPFFPLSIVPYMASGLFFCLVFFLCKNKYQLKILTWRMLFVIISAGILFLIFPLRFSYAKPVVHHPVLNIPFSFLKTFDSPFNQSPSLHIAFAFIFWSVFKDIAKWRTFLMIWLILLGFSTLTTYQHHCIDILSGAILAHITFIIVPYRKNDFRYRNFQVANYYFLSGWIFFTIALLFYHFIHQSSAVLSWITLWITLWITFILFIIGYHYQKNNIHFLKNKNGNIPMFKKVLYAPYVLIYWLFWKFSRKNKNPVEIIHNIYISSKPGRKDLMYFTVDKGTFVYDLSAEIEENKSLRRNGKYQFFPFLDIGSFDIHETKRLVTEITHTYHHLPKGGKILIHCTMGFTRSSVIGILVMKNILSLSIEEAVIQMQKVNKNAVIHSYLLDFLKKI